MKTENTKNKMELEKNKDLLKFYEDIDKKCWIAFFILVFFFSFIYIFVFSRFLPSLSIAIVISIIGLIMFDYNWILVGKKIDELREKI